MLLFLFKIPAFTTLEVLLLNTSAIGGVKLFNSQVNNHIDQLEQEFVPNLSPGLQNRSRFPHRKDLKGLPWML